jgi:polyisoprenoid-binding protein YceI
MTTTASALKRSEEVNVSTDQKTTQVTQRWVVDPARSTIEFRVGNWWGLTTVVGHFSRFDGSYTVGPGGRAIELIVEAESLETGNRRRNKHLRSSDFFDVESHPHVRFTADDARRAHAAAPLWVDDTGDRTGVPRIRVDRGAAHPAPSSSGPPS